MTPSRSTKPTALFPERPRWPRSERGLLSRPTVAEVFRYRAYVDEYVTDLLQSASASAEMKARIILGVNHEQQHQELILTDIKHAWATNRMHPVYRAHRRARPAPVVVNHVK